MLSADFRLPQTVQVSGCLPAVPLANLDLDKDVQIPSASGWRTCFCRLVLKSELGHDDGDKVG